jgi:uncharacterized membrane protein YjfL (UPF0719 family)
MLKSYQMIDSRSAILTMGSFASWIAAHLSRQDILFWLTIGMMITTIVYNVIRLIKQKWD